MPAKINEAIEKVDEMKPCILNFVDELKAVLEVYETDDLENSFEKLTVFSQKKREYDKCLDYLKTLKYVEMMK